MPGPVLTRSPCVRIVERGTLDSMISMQERMTREKTNPRATNSHFLPR